MRITGVLLIIVGLGWLILSQLAGLLPKAGNYSSRLEKLPAQDSYTREQVKEIVWDVSAFRWDIPEQQTYSPQEVTNILFTASMNTRARDGTNPSVFVPNLLLVAGAFCLGLGIGEARDDKRAA